MLLTGLRGVGKTVLLNEIEHLAKDQGYRTIFIEAHENKSLGPLIVPYLRTLLFDLNRIAGASDKGPSRNNFPILNCAKAPGV